MFTYLNLNNYGNVVMGLMNCTDCGSQHSDANGTICPNCGRKHKVSIFEVSDEQKEWNKLNIAIHQEFDQATENFGELRDKYNDNPTALEIIGSMEEAWHGDASTIGSKKFARNYKIALFVLGLLMIWWLGGFVYRVAFAWMFE